MSEQTYSIADLAALAGISPQRIYQLLRTDKGPPVNLVIAGKKHFYEAPQGPALVWLMKRYPQRAREYAEAWLAVTDFGILELPR